MVTNGENGLSVEPGTVTADPSLAGVEQMLSDGESIILAVKPSSWFVLLVSLPVLAGLTALAAGAYVADRYFGYTSIPLRSAGMILAFLALLRVMIASFQWLGRLYVLTNRRVIRIHGIMRMETVECPLIRVGQTLIDASTPERVLGVASLVIQRNDNPGEPIVWMHLAEPLEIQKAIEDAARKARNNLAK